MTSAAPVTIKKYGNRRLYDTQDSRYITLEELAEKVRAGTDVRVVDVKTGADLTQPTLTQIIIESRGAAKLLPVNLLTQLIRLGDDALAEFLGRYVSGALEIYQQVRRGAQSVAPYNPLASLPLAATDALARLWMSNPFHAAAAFPGSSTLWGGGRTGGEAAPAAAANRDGDGHPASEPQSAHGEGQAPTTDATTNATTDATTDEVAALRRELEELKRSMKTAGQAAPKQRKPSRRQANPKR